jgi:myo-inositol-1(or 4)-monophosphatase
MSTSFTATAAEAALRAGKIQRAHYGEEIDVEHKGAIDLVTHVDRACEEAILETLRERHPDHDVVAEESGPERTGSPYVWYVDPLDGTTNFAHSYPVFSASVALTKDGRAISGAVYDPLREELFTAERGAGARLNGRPLHTTRETELIKSLLITGFPYDVHDHPERVDLFRRFVTTARGVRRGGSAAIDLCYVAAGRADGFWEEVLNPWDYLAGSLVVEEAGGRVTRFDDSPISVEKGELLATNGPLHAAMLDALRDEKARR